MQVLDHGFVELIDTMGDEQEVARAARISYGNHESRTLEQDMKLSKYLWENQHTSPFEMIELKWRVKCPIFVARQWLRHRTANVNEMSLRYTELDEVEYYLPDVWRAQDTKNKQGSEGLALSQTESIVDYLYAVEAAISSYYSLIKDGVAREQARMVLPVSTYTEFVWKNDLHNTLHFLKLRADSHAQWEIQQYAEAMLQILRDTYPNLMEVVWPTD